MAHDEKKQEELLQNDMKDSKDFKDFSEFHGVQLRALGVPVPLHKEVYEKLTKNQFDIGDKANMVLDEDAQQLYLRASEDLQAVKDVYLIDHLWTFKHRNIHERLMNSEKLRTRLDNLMRYSGKLDLPGQNQFAPNTGLNTKNREPVNEDSKEERLKIQVLAL